MEDDIEPFKKQPEASKASEHPSLSFYIWNLAMIVLMYLILLQTMYGFPSFKYDRQ